MQSKHLGSITFGEVSIVASLVCCYDKYMQHTFRETRLASSAKYYSYKDIFSDVWAGMGQKGLLLGENEGSRKNARYFKRLGYFCITTEELLRAD